MLPSELPDIGNTTTAVDTETSGLHPDDGATTTAVSVAYLDNNDQTVYHTWPFDQGELDKTPQPTLELYANPNLPQTEWVALLRWLEQRRLVMHNGKFDCTMLRRGTRKWEGTELIHRLAYDTMLANREIWPTHPTGLKATAAALGLLGGGERDDEEALKKALKTQGRKLKIVNGQKRYDLLPWETIEPYAARDAQLTMLLYLRQQQELETGTGDRRLINRELAVLKVLYAIETRGIGFNAARCIQAAGDLKKAKRELSRGLPYPATITGAKTYYFGKPPHGLDLIPYQVSEKNGKPELNDTVIRRMITDQVPHIELYQQCRKIDVALSMWYEAYPNGIGTDGRLRTSYRQTKEQGEGGGGAVSGRFSVERFNLQAVPHASRLDLPDGIPTPREFFEPKPGHQLYELDFQQAELRVAAKLAGCKPMLEQVAANQDLHGNTAKELFHITEQDTDWFKYRQIAKRGNFAFIFGVGADTFRHAIYNESGIDLTAADAKDIVDAWRGLYPEFTRAIHRYDRMAERDRYVRLVNGRQRWFYPYEHTHKAFNQTVQGSLAELAKQWALLTERDHPGCLILLVHDSEILEVPEGEQGLEIVRAVAETGGALGTRWMGVQFGVDYGLFGEH